MNNRPAYCAGQSNPSENCQFRRRWTESRHPDRAMAMAMDRHADLLLAAGQHIAAEWLSHAAAKLRREGGQ